MQEFTKTYIDRALLGELQHKVILDNELLEGKYSEQLSARLRDMSQFKHCELFGSGSQALFAAASVARKYTDPDTVVEVPTHSYASIYSAIKLAGFGVTLKDCDVTTGLTETEGEVTVHQCIAEQKPTIKNNSFSIEDNAWTISPSYIEKPTFSMFSMSNSKLLNCGLGGALFYDDDKFTEDLRKFKFLGAGGYAHAGFKRQGAGHRMSFDDWRAILVLSQLDNIENIRRDLGLVKTFLGTITTGLDENPGFSAQYLINDTEQLPPVLKRNTWVPVHHYVQTEQLFPNADHVYTTKRLAGTNIDSYKKYVTMFTMPE